MKLRGFYSTNLRSEGIMSKSVEFGVENRIRDILASSEYSNPDHHLGRPFLTPYQIAIEFARLHPLEFAGINLPIGGRDSGVKSSLPQYIAGELSQRIRTEAITDIEGGFISNLHVADIRFDSSRPSIASSLTGTQFDLSIFRLIDR